MLHKKYLKPSALTRFLMILNASGPGPQIPPSNPPPFVSIDNASFSQAPDQSSSKNISPIPEPTILPRFGGDSKPRGSDWRTNPSLSEDGALTFPDSNRHGSVFSNNPSLPEDGALTFPDSNRHGSGSGSVTSRPESDGPNPNLDDRLASIFGTPPANNGRAQSAAAALRAVTQSANKFSSDLFRSIGEMIPGNIVCSAVSAWMVLAMATYGARGHTERQMRSALALPKNNAVAKLGFRTLIDSFENYKIAEVRIANKIFIDRAIRPKANFRRMTKTGFRSKVQRVDFANPTVATNVINQWCEDHTNNRIKNLFKSGDLDPSTAMVLVNAVYFKGQWEARFNASKTVLKPFRVNSTLTRNVPMMFNRGEYRTGYLDDLDASFVEIPYKSAGDNDALSMFIVMPRNPDGLPELEKNMDRITMERLSDTEPPEDTFLYLPKFKIESDMTLENVLQKMHMGGIFEDNADFTGIIDNPPISVTQVVQKAFIEVSEEGTEATAATGVGIGLRSGSYVFNANGPFMGCIGAPRRKNSVMLFNFRYTGPVRT